MNSYPEQAEFIIELLKEFPGIGQRGAERVLFTMLKWDTEKIKKFGDMISDIPEKIKFCKYCGNISEDHECYVCKDSKRNSQLICVVENYEHIIPIEKSGYDGLYHVLGGKISPLEDSPPESLNISSLINRINKNSVEEIIIALSQDIEGQATSAYITDLLKDKKIKITKIARGLPAGSDLSFANADTINAAIDGRKSVDN